MRGRERVELVAILRSSTDPWLRADALDELAARRTPDVVPEIVPALGDPDREVRRIASDSLAELGDPAALGPLHLALNHERDPAVRAELAEAIDELRDR
jgi:HEAT repeat protein